ncbi:hypothetical protein [Nocardioides sp. YIM 152315]|uniref:hypothetical protein n=1 Tax=Nocardioides sp. YIM 152315 TaxID=3031760 RepID=UPI0023DA4823|nr:hypothetical protein [Nocardioides sp. YIM 152315]MDF1602706.1 hypothetical protein [Nocardioides sp. YIM 152315]
MNLTRVTLATAQVQSRQGGQVAVTWTEDTTFTEQVDGTLDDVTVGACAVVTTGAETSQDSTEEVAEVAAATVRATEANDGGGCGFGAGGPGRGEPPEGTPTDRPSDRPSDLPGDLSSDAPNGPRVRGVGTVGEVTAVSADGFTLSTITPDSDDAAEVTVTVGDDTTYTTTADAKSSAVSVGRCVTARGESDDTGAVTADTISVSDPVDGECGLGFVRRDPEGGDTA